VAIISRSAEVSVLGLAQQDFRKFKQGFGGIRAESEWAHNAKQLFRKLNVRHELILLR
jgi:hypothetical protein